MTVLRNTAANSSVCITTDSILISHTTAATTPQTLTSSQQLTVSAIGIPILPYAPTIYQLPPYLSMSG